MPSNFDPSPGAGAVLRDSILQLLDRPQAPNKRWWSITDLLEQSLKLPVSKDSETAEVLDNYLRAVAILGTNHPTGDHQILCAGLLTWTKLPNYKHLVVTFETGDGRGATLPPVTDIGENYYLKLPSLTHQSNQVGPTAHPDPYPAVNKLISEIVTDLLCFEGPTALYSYTVKELPVRLTTLSVNMGYAKRSGIRLFCNYLRMYAAEHSVPTVDDQLVFCIGLLRWAKFPINNCIYVIFESNLPCSHPGDRWRIKLNDDLNPSDDATHPASCPVPIVPWTVPPTGNPSPELDAILSKLITDLLRTPSPSSDRWWTAGELLLGMDVSPTYLERGTVLTNYLHSWRGYTHPIQNWDIRRESCTGLIRWVDQPSKKTIYLVNEIVDDDGELGPEDRYYLSLVETVISSNPAPATPDSPPPPPPPRDNMGPPINVKGNPGVPATPSDRFSSHPDPDPTVNQLLGKTVNSLLCFQGPTSQDSYTVSELVQQLTELSEGMTADKKYEVCLFRRYLQLCAAEYSVTTGDDHRILCMGLLRWAKFPKNNLTYICFESHPPASHLGERWRVRINDFDPDENSCSTPVTTPTPCATTPMALFA